MRRYTLEIRGREFVVDVDEVSADTFAVQVGQETYEVTLTGDQDLSMATISPQIAGSATASTAAATRALGAKRSAPSVAPAAPKAMPAGAGILKAPMPGVILQVSVTAGAKVERGQDIAVLEAMKMQNTIRSPRAGTIAEVFVVVGQSVGHGDAIVRFEETS